MAVSKAERERRAAERKRKFEERKAAMDKKIKEVQEGRAAGMTMTEIRAKRMNISAKELKQKQLATLLGMGEGMAMFLPFGAAVRGGMLVYKGLKGAKAARALKTAAANAKKTADAKKVSSATSNTKPRVRVPAGSSKPRTAPNTAKEAGRTKLTPKGKKLVTGAAIGTGVGLTALGLAGRSAYDSITKRDKPAKPRTAPDTSSERGRKGTPKRTTKITAGPNVGFGPKGNQFPKDAADRRRLMAMYGGTGSAAAKAAAQGKQGNLKKGKK